MNEQEEFEQLIFKRNKNAAIIFSIIVAGILLLFFSYASVMFWKISYIEYIYWSLTFLILFGVMLIPCTFGRYFFMRYCHKIESMGDGMQAFMTDKHKQERCNEMQNIMEIIGSVGDGVLWVMFSVLYFMIS